MSTRLGKKQGTGEYGEARGSGELNSVGERPVCVAEYTLPILPRLHDTIEVSPSVNIQPRVFTFLIRCPNSLGFPKGSSQYIQLPAQLSGFANVALHLNPDGSPTSAPITPDHLFVSAKFHLGRRLTSAIYSNLHEMHSVLSLVLPEEVTQGLMQENSTGDDDLDLWSNFSVGELTTPVAMHGDDGVYVPCEVTHDLTGEAFERSVEALFLIIRAYRLSEKLTFHTPTRERLGPTFYVTTRKASAGDGPWDRSAEAVVNGLAIPPAKPPDLDVSGIERLNMAVYAEVIGHPTVPVAELQAEARSALSEGDYRAAVMLFHTASEVHLDMALMLMQWEEGLTPDAASMVFRKPLMERARTQYHIRIGGTWATRNGTVCDTWQRNLVFLRHRTIHAGYPVHPPEAYAASEAWNKLRTFLTDRIAASVKRYPLTAAIVVSDEGFRKRGRITRTIKEALELPTSDRIVEFNVWRTQLIQIRSTNQ